MIDALCGIIVFLAIAFIIGGIIEKLFTGFKS